MLFQYISKHRVGIIAVVMVLVAAAGAVFAQSEPLVSCGRTGTVSCNLCDLYVLAKNVINFALFWLALPVAVIVFLWGGILLLTSRGSEEQLKQGKAALTNAVLGIIIAFAAWLIINTLLVTLGFGVPFTKGVLPWNTFPTCEAPIATTFIPPAQREACDPTKTKFRTCTTIDGAKGQQVCNTDGFWSACREFCDLADVGKTKKCTIGGCDGSQTCTQAGSAAYWDICKDDPSDACIPQLGGGTCTPTQQGNCAVNNLASICFGDLAAEASQICIGESGGNASKGSNVDKTADGRSFSWGLFQINLTAHDIAGFNCSPGDNTVTGLVAAFAKDTNGKWIVADQSMFTKCVVAAQNPRTNVEKACQIRTAAGNWSKDWTNIARNCGLP